jgi:hypothetical protein
LRDFGQSAAPQWDALGISDRSDVLIVEAKAHIAELNSPPSAAGEKSMRIIQIALDEAALAFGVPAHIKWNTKFYQLANRLAHLHFLRKLGVPAWLVLANFVGDKDMRGPVDERTWDVEYEKAFAALGITANAPLLQHVLHVYPRVESLN